MDHMYYFFRESTGSRMRVLLEREDNSPWPGKGWKQLVRFRASDACIQEMQDLSENNE